MGDNYSPPLISTTVLNWNRADLLRRTLESYRATVTVPYEMFIVDNASSDDSRKVIEEFCAATPAATAIYLDKNIGGAAINQGLERSTAPILHLSENDYEYQPGWVEEAQELFRCFPTLGQLSLCAPVPEDEEAWETKPSILRASQGRFVYEAVGNVITSCLLRRELWDAGLRVGSNTNKHGVLLPDDVGISASVRRAGFMCAWAPRYLARNLGHAATELESRNEYYNQSYDAKDWVGTDGLRNRVEAWRSRARPKRTSILFQDQTAYPESSVSADFEADPRLWSMFDGRTADVETLEFLYGLVRAVKPKLAVETRAWRGRASDAIARALLQNGFGQLLSIENDADCRDITAERLKRSNALDAVALMGDRPTGQQMQAGVDLLLLDGPPQSHAMELQAYSPYLRQGALIVAYRSADAGEPVPDSILRSNGSVALELLPLPTPRGLVLARCKHVSTSAAESLVPTRARRKHPSARSTAVLVLGMHRSGTSALARVLNLHGVQLGNSLLQRDAANERGYWEHTQLMLLHDKILSKVGRSWLDHHSLPVGWWDQPGVQSFADDLAAIVGRDFAGFPVWGAKDPRLCRLLPLWHRVLANLWMEPRYVIPVRSPYEVADSLARRDGLPRIQSLLLWLRYTLEAERYSRGVPRAFTTYDQLMSDWRNTVAHIVDQTGLFLPISPHDAADQVESFLSPSLRHHVGAGCDGVPRVLQLLLQGVYGAFVEAAISHREPDPGFLDQAHAELNTLESLFSESSQLDYGEWRSMYGLRESDAQLMAERMVLRWKTKPAIHLLIPLRRGDAGLIGTTLQSLSDQLYSGWGLTVVAEDPCPEDIFDQVPNVEWRQARDGLVAELNRAVSDTDADWVGLLRAGDQLAPQGLFSCVDHLQQSPNWNLIYTDEDCLDESGALGVPWFKTEVDRDLLRSGDCLGGFCLVRRGVLLTSGGYGAGPGVENYDLALKVFERFGAGGIGHIPEILYHRGPVSDGLAGPHCMDWRRAALVAHLDRCHEEATISEGLTPHSLRVCYTQPIQPTVSVIIAIRDDLQVVESCIDSLRETTSLEGIELVLVDEGSEAEDTQDYLAAIQSEPNVRVLAAPDTGSRAAAYNAAARTARGYCLAFVDRHAIFVQGSWLADLTAQVQRVDVGMVAPRLVGPDRIVVHSALLLGVNGIAADAFAGRSVWDGVYFQRALTDQGVSAVPDGCLMLRRDVFEELGGFDEQLLPNVWYHVDFALRLRQRNLRVLWTPHTLLGWQTAGQHQRELSRSADENRVMLDRWAHELANDSAYNRNLSLSHRDFRPRTESTSNWSPSFHDRPRVLGFPADTFGCGEYRVLAPLNALDTAALARCGFTTPQEGRPEVPSPVELKRLAPDTLLLQATLYDEHLEALAGYKRHTNAFCVYDLEDLKSDIPLKNSRRKTVLRDIKARTRRALSYCDRLIVTTEPLAEAYRGLMDDIRVIPNYLPRSRWNGLQSLRRQSSRPRIGWAGGQQHAGDLELLLPVIEATAAEVDWVFFGMCPDVFRPHVREVHEFGAFEEYPTRLASLNLDLAVAPLEMHAFNIAKSNLRILEYGVLGLPVICTDIEPYQGAPVKRVPNDPQSWIAALRERSYDLDGAAAEGDQLKDWVTSRWMLEDHLDEWLRGLMPDESELAAPSYRLELNSKFG